MRTVAGTRTRFLVAIAIAALAFEFFPQHAPLIRWMTIVLGVAFLCVQGLRTYPKLYRQRRERARLEADDARDYQRYKEELDAMRAKHTATTTLDSISPDLAAELDALHDKYEAMLARKFGPVGRRTG